MPQDNGGPIPLSRWQPKRIDRSKRKLDNYLIPGQTLAGVHEQQTAELDDIIAEMDWVSDTGRVILLARMNDLFSVADSVKRQRQVPPASEVKELLEGFVVVSESSGQFRLGPTAR